MRLMAGICIGEDEPVACGVRVGLDERVALSNPAGGRFATFYKLDVRVSVGDFLDDFAGFVSGSIVDDDDFVVGIVLPRKRFQASRNFGFFVAGRNDHRNERQLLDRNDGRADAAKECQKNMREPCQAHNQHRGQKDYGEGTHGFLYPRGLRLRMGKFGKFKLRYYHWKGAVREA